MAIRPPHSVPGMSHIRAVLVVLLATSVAVHSLDECFFAWSERSAPEECSTSTDCESSEASCIFSIAANKHICCKPKAGAVLPECPGGMASLSLGSPHNMILCNGEGDDICPDGFSCMKSVTDFTKASGQSNHICCQ
uniref:Secreted protein n=1 Tax=Steinernema glaseri TaxID=37863 RepID=A0A1I7Z7S6_9BILA